MTQDKLNKPKRRSLFGEYVYFLKTYKAWWLVPLFLLVALLGVLVMLGGTKAGLLIYALF
ncbi:MAG TPA: DUF5989 family protein [Candidatus Omnitrophota bacterium]|nr:DUF5989 family protein [Candidatus Omnitrophota bacterium]